MLRPLLGLLLFAFSVAVQAQSATFSGYVRDAATGETLIGANLYAPALKTGTVTNAYGFFSLALPADSAAVLVSYLGYDAQRLVLTPAARAPAGHRARAHRDGARRRGRGGRARRPARNDADEHGLGAHRANQIAAGALGRGRRAEGAPALARRPVRRRGHERALRARRRAGPEPDPARRRAGLQREPPLRLFLHLQRRRAQKRGPDQGRLSGALRRAPVVGDRPAHEGGEYARGGGRRAPSASWRRGSRSRGRS